MTVSFHLAHSPLVSGIFGYNLPAAIVLVVSIVIGFLMVIVSASPPIRKPSNMRKINSKPTCLPYASFKINWAW